MYYLNTMQNIFLRLAATIGFLLFAFNQHVKGQMIFVTDTLELNMFTIEQSREHAFDAGNKTIEADTIVLQHHEDASLTDLLGSLAPVNIRTRGTSGALSTLSLRGAGASRTLVTWNGIALNSLTTGDVNMSLLYANAFNSISLNYSAPATLYGGSSFGGVVELNNEPEFRQTSKFGLAHYRGSFNTHNSTLNALFSNKIFYSKTNVWVGSSDNNFNYYDRYYNRTMKRQNAAQSNTGAITTNSFRINTNQILSSGLWYGANRTDLPPINGSHPNLILASQEDQSVRGYLKWILEHHAFYVSVKTYVFDEYIRFTQKNSPGAETYSIYSLIRPLKAGMDADFRYTINRNITVDAGSTVYHNLARGSNYEAIPRETNFALFSAVQYHNGQFSTVASVRKEFHTQYDPPVRFGIGSEYKLLNDMLLIRASLNQKFRIPTFNDKYWPQSGNPLLKPESGSTKDIGIAFHHTIKHINIHADVGAYVNSITNMIVWEPADAGLWKPVNSPYVKSKGLESSLKLTVAPSKDLIISQNANFNVNQARENDTKRQLVYTPKYRFSTSNAVFFKDISSLLTFTYLSRRRYDKSENTLPEFFMVNYSVFYNLNLSFAQFKISAKINNVFNHIEPYVKDYPVPGRHFLLGLNVSIN